MDNIFNTTALADLIGILGFALYVISYFLLTFRYLNSDSMLYFGLNFAAASFVLYGLTTSFNLASALIQFFWITISLIGIAIRFSKPRNLVS